MRHLLFPALQMRHLGYAKSPAAIAGLTYLFRDDFTIPDAAPITVPINADHVGTWGVITDTGNNLSIANNRLEWAGSSANANDPKLISGANYAKVTGMLAIIGFERPSIADNIHWQAGIAQNNGTGSQIYWIKAQNSPTTIQSGVNTSAQAQQNFSIAANTPYNFMILLQTNGAYLLLEQGGVIRVMWRTYTNPTLSMYVVPVRPPSAVSAPGDLYINHAAMIDMPTNGYAVLNGEYSLMESQAAGSVAAGTTGTHSADCIIDWTVTTRPSASTSSFKFRKQDANNYWELTVGSTGTITLNEVVAGVATSRGSSAAAISSGHRMSVRMSGQVIEVYGGSNSDTFRILYLSATNFQSATAWELAALGTSGVITTITVTPPTLPNGAAKTALLAAIPA